MYNGLLFVQDSRCHTLRHVQSSCRSLHAQPKARGRGRGEGEEGNGGGEGEGVEEGDERAHSASATHTHTHKEVGELAREWEMTERCRTRSEQD